MILVTDATGNVGSAVVGHLKRAGVEYRVLGRTPPVSSDENEASLRFRSFDFLRQETFATAFEGGERLFLVRPPALGKVRTQIVPAIEGARAAGIKQVVFLSIVGAERSGWTPHRQIEVILESSGMAYTFLRAGFFMQNLSTVHRPEIHDRNEILMPAGRGKTSFVDCRDIAEVGAMALLKPGHERKAYDLTGAQALDYEEVASLFTEVLGRKITYDRTSVARFAADRLRSGTKPGMVAVMCLLYSFTRWGQAAQISHDLPRLLGRPPTSLRQFLVDHRDVRMTDGERDGDRS